MKFAILLLFNSCTLIRMFPDNPLEEGIENIIENQTGVKIDFTGDTPEN